MATTPDTTNTALILVGFQNDYFAPDGVLRSALEDSRAVDQVRAQTLRVLRALEPTDATIVSTPILFTDDYRELVEPVGILKAIAEAGAFRRGTAGGESIEEFAALRDRILEVPGKRGLSAFSNTDLEQLLRDRHIEHVVMAGVVTSICIDSTARAAQERGFAVTVLSDCTAGRTRFEQDFYCREVFPLYARVRTSVEVMAELAPAPREAVGVARP